MGGMVGLCRGLKPKTASTALNHTLSNREVAAVVQRGGTEHGEADRIRGVGFRSMAAPSMQAQLAVAEAGRAQLPGTVEPAATAAAVATAALATAGGGTDPARHERHKHKKEKKDKKEKKKRHRSRSTSASPPRHRHRHASPHA
jgi:hypothetical protein